MRSSFPLSAKIVDRVAVNKQDLLAKSIEFLRLRQSKEVEHKALLQGATSALHVDLNEVGGIKSKRLDLLISSGRNRKGGTPGGTGDNLPLQK